MKYTRIIILLLAVLGLSMTSCKKNDEPEQPADRMILVYMAANNSLGSGPDHWDEKDISEMQTAVKNGALGDNNRLMLFHAASDGSQVLYELLSTGELKPVVTYPGNDYAISSDFMLQVFADARNYAPAADYGLIMWSHALGWTQNGQVDDGPTIKPKTWGDDRGHTMNITTLARVLGALKWSWVYFDCCYMGCVEVAYELAPAVDRMVASPSELPLDGMPYNKNLPLLFKPQADLVGAARNTYEYYANLTDEQRWELTQGNPGVLTDVTISVFDLTKMESLAEATRTIYSASNIVNPNDFWNLPLDDSNSPKFYDLGVYVDGLTEVNGLNSGLEHEWNKAYDNVVIYRASTPKLYLIDLERFTGMSTFIPTSEAQQTFRNYNTLSWYRDVARYLYNK